MPFWAVAVARRDGGQRRIPVTAAAAVDPTDGDVARAALVRAWSPHERLRIAVLLHALHELRRYPADSRYAKEARRWVVSNDAHWPCSFVAICDVLGLEPAAVRARVLGSPDHAVTPPAADPDTSSRIPSPDWYTLRRRSG
jgi:hypothetical protein